MCLFAEGQPCLQRVKPGQSTMLTCRYPCRRAFVRVVSWDKHAAGDQQVAGLSTTSSNDIKQMYHKTREVLSKFGTGMKSLFADGKQAFRTYKRLSNGALVTADEAKVADGDREVITVTIELRRDYLHMRDTVQAITKVFPLILLWIPPGLGLLPPLLFVYFPRQMFTQHFWTEAEKDEFARIHHEFRATQFQGLRAMVAQRLGSGSDAEGPSLDGLVEKAERFEDKGELSLASLPAPHVKSLAKAVQLYEVPWLVDLLPSPYLRWALRSRASEVLIDDLMLRAAGCGQLTPQELRQACDMRGLPALGAAQADALREQLQAYLSTHDRLGGASGGDKPEATAARQYSMWWPGHGGSDEALATLLRAARQGKTTRHSGEGGAERRGHEGSDKTVGRAASVPPVSLLLHVPAVLKQ